MMPARGPKPKPAEQRRRTNESANEWRLVPNVPYAGPSPDLPGESWSAFALSWWATVRAMPHCSLWSDSDWLFAIETAMIADRFAENQKDYAAELRQRAKVLGVTDDDRRRLFIRYVDPEEISAGENVAKMEDYRELYG